MSTRRDVLKGLGAAGLAPLLGLPRGAWAAARTDLRFVFVFNPGGWDPTRVFTWQGTNPAVSTEPTAERRESGDVLWVDHPDRPNVASFFARRGASLTVLNGLMVPSITHEVCTQLVLTGASAAGPADWASTLAHGAEGGEVLPHLVLGGPSFPGPYASSVARTGNNGQLAALLSGSLLRGVGVEGGGLSSPEGALVDRYLAQRAGARVLAARSETERALAEAYERSLGHGRALKEQAYTLDLTVGFDLGQQAEVAVDVLSRGLCRCTSLAFAGSGRGWDTHSDNDAEQSALFDGLFQGLERLASLLEQTPGPNGAALSTQTVVVVLSEMGRTPQLNGGLGKDHWPYTSALLWGPGLRPGTFGGYDGSFNGAAIDLASGGVNAGGVRVVPGMLGATLWALAGLDAGEVGLGAPVVRGVLG